MVLLRVVFYKLMVTKVKIHFKMCYRFSSVIGNCYSSYKMQPWLPHTIKIIITYMSLYIESILC